MTDQETDEQLAVAICRQIADGGWGGFDRELGQWIDASADLSDAQMAYLKRLGTEAAHPIDSKDDR